MDNNGFGSDPAGAVRWQPGLIEGLYVAEDLLDCEEEEVIIEAVHKLESNTLGVQLRNRKTKHYGYVFNAKTLGVDEPNDETKMIPSWALELISKFHPHGLLHDYYPDQMTINEYLPKKGISGHVDTHSAFDDIIAVVSLGSDVTITFANKMTQESVDLWVPRRSGLVMSGEARYLFTHKITSRSTDLTPEGLVQSRGNRISITYRKVLIPAVCNCKYPQLCDTQNPESFLPADRNGFIFADKG